MLSESYMHALISTSYFFMPHMLFFLELVVHFTTLSLHGFWNPCCISHILASFNITVSIHLS